MKNKNPKKSLFLNYFKPSIYIESVQKIDLDGLVDSGIRLILCDMDNTLLKWNERIPSHDAITFISHVKEKGLDFILFSNNSRGRVENFAQKAGVTNYFWDCKKPLLGKINLVKKMVNYKESEMIIIGDQLVTDVLVANRAHIKSILVKPLSRVNRGSKILLFFEQLIFKKLEQKNILHVGFYNEGDLGGDYEIL